MIRTHALLAPALFTLLNLGCAPVPDISLSEKFLAAQKTFDQASSPDEFLRAASLYQEIRRAGLVSGAVLYNQGNAYMRAGERGRAIACYRQAKRYRPRDPFLDANLRYALGGGADGSSSTRLALVDYLFFWQGWISYPEKYRLAAAAAVLAFLAGVAALYVRRRLFARVAAAALLLTILLGCSALLDTYRYDWTQHGVVVRGGVVARKGNAESYEPAFTEPLAETTEFQVVERRGRWLLVRIDQSKEGWVQQKDVVVY